MACRPLVDPCNNHCWLLLVSLVVFAGNGWRPSREGWPGYLDRAGASEADDGGWSSGCAGITFAGRWRWTGYPGRGSRDHDPGVHGVGGCIGASVGGAAVFGVSTLGALSRIGRAWGLGFYLGES
ncbi:hypothetical protein RchiOBHm_Chr2g0088021 [Rosa chinensis]|uniref:Uncharacterized protein n=1 Tax=Rosa chinensis TaxID=74649 RepID=A0A2P6RIW8_ROSCH|nr:hypothetical protein RchiOBHm_Chr2g0088021 [Rosa chinensis]